MNTTELRELLEQVRSGVVDPAEASGRLTAVLRQAPFEDVGFARIDYHRDIRKGFAEVIFGSGKTPAQIATIAERLVAHGRNLLITRADEAAYLAVSRMAPRAIFHPEARAITLQQSESPPGRGVIAIAAAGTADLPVALEAAVTAEFLGNEIECFYDVGIAGLHRLLREYERLSRARVIVAVAGMEGALASVIGGLVDTPVIAVPTSVGYGTSLGGLAALLAMLNTCAPGVSVVNIDNGFGGAVCASLINHL